MRTRDLDDFARTARAAWRSPRRRAARTIVIAGSKPPPLSTTLTRRIWSLPTTPKRGASTSSMRRSRSPSWPVISACSGALKPSASAFAGMSWTRPSVTRIAAPILSGATSFSASASAENSSVPSAPVPTAHETRLDVGRFREGVFERLARRVDLRHAGAESLALAAVEHDGDDALLRLALLAHQRRVGERGEQQAPGPARAIPRSSARRKARSRERRARRRSAARRPAKAAAA